MRKERITAFLDEMLKELREIAAAYDKNKAGTIEILKHSDDTFNDDQFPLVFTNPKARKYFMKQRLLDGDDIRTNIYDMIGRLDAAQTAMKFWRDTNETFNNRTFTRILMAFNQDPKANKKLIARYSKQSLLNSHDVLIEFADAMTYEIDQIMSDYKADPEATMKSLQKPKNAFSADVFSDVFKNDAARRELLHQVITKDNKLDSEKATSLKKMCNTMFKSLKNIHDDNLDSGYAKRIVKHHVQNIITKLGQDPKFESNQKLITGLPGSISHFNYKLHQSKPPTAPPKPEGLVKSVRAFKEAQKKAAGPPKNLPPKPKKLVDSVKAIKESQKQKKIEEQQNFEPKDTERHRSLTERAAHRVTKRTGKGEDEDTRNVAQRAIHRVAKRAEQKSKDLAEKGIFKKRKTKEPESEEDKTANKGGPK